MLLIERIPTLSILVRNQAGLGPTFTLSISRAEKNGHSRNALIFILDVVAAAVTGGSWPMRTSAATCFPVNAAISRAA